VSDDLIVSGGGRVAVASDELLAQMEGLSRFEGELDEIGPSLGAEIARVPEDWLRQCGAPTSAFSARSTAVLSVARIAELRRQTDLLAGLLRIAIDVYGFGEGCAVFLAQQLSDQLAYAAGLLAPLTASLAAPVVAVVAVPAIGVTAGGTFLASLITGRSFAEALGALGGAATKWLTENNEVLTNPTAVALVRAAVGSGDDFLSGLLRRPWGPLQTTGQRLPGDEGLPFTGEKASAEVLMSLGTGLGVLGVNVLSETPVATKKTSTSAGTVPTSLADRASRIPRPEEELHGEQVRIDRYHVPGGPDRFEVYVAGTVDFAVDPSGEPWDMTSNIAGIAGAAGFSAGAAQPGATPSGPAQPGATPSGATHTGEASTGRTASAGSYRAVREAMDDAGITSSSPVVLNGYSQGGLVAALIASSGAYNVAGVVTFGAPAGQVALPATIPVLTVRHSDDIVPATGGPDVNRRAVVVERELFAGEKVPPGLVLPAHQLSYYQQTAGLIDAADSDEVKAALAGLAGFTASAVSVETTTWAATRTTVSGAAR
jgi:hypothetical protein